MQGRAIDSSVIASTLIGGAMLPHAPQFFTMPETEDRDTVERVRAQGLRCETGQFQAMMQLELVNEGPVTILLNSEKTI